MKPRLLSTARLSLSLASALAALLAAPSTHAANLYWDVNGTGTGFSTVVGAWDGTNAFWNDQITGTGGTPTATVGNTDDLNIVAATTNTGTITLSGTQAASSITFASAVGSVTMSGGTSLTIGGTGALSGIFKSSASAQTISTPIILNTASEFSNAAAGNLSCGPVNLNGNALTFSGSGIHTFVGSASNVISGAGGIVKNGSGTLILDAAAPNAAHTFSGGITVNGGTITQQTGANLTGRGNVTVNGGILGMRFGSNLTFAGGLGTGTTAIQILGGTSGFSGEGGTGSTATIGTSLSVLKWGATGVNGATGFLNPTVLVLGGDANMNTNAKGTLANGIDLNGTNRTITSLHSNGDGASTTGFTVTGTIVNTAGTTAGFEKTGPGNVILSNTGNTYNGATTITGGSLTVGSSGSLGNASATNTLTFNGGTLLASAAFNSAITRAVTMTTSGIINTNTFAVGILGNIDGPGGLTKNSTGALTLSGTNTFGGVTTVNAGSLVITKEVSLASNTAANLNVKSGATLQLNVDSAGTAGFTSANLSTLLGNISVANTSAQGLQSGAILAFDTTTATGSTFTQGNAITNSTGASGGTINFVKLGTGTLVFDKANTYTGTTTVTAGTLRFDTGGSVAGQIINNATVQFNQTGSLTAGTAPLTNIGGTGSISAGPSATIAITTPTGLQFTGLDTSGGGSFVLSGVTTPTFGGLSGTTGNLSSAFSSGYNGVTNLTLNTPSGTTFTYGGVINDGAVGMHLTKTGAGTQILTGTNTYTGTTFLNGGTLQLGVGSTIGKISGTTAIQFNGGTLQFNRSTAADIDAINNAATVTVNSSSTFGVTSADAGNANANETVGAVTLNAGQMNFNWTNGGSSGTQMILTSLSRSGTASANFNSGFASNSSRWKVTGAGTTTGGQIVGPWYTTGGNNANFASTDYATFSSDFVAQAAIAGSAETTWTTAANAYTTSAGGTVTLTGTRTITALRNTGATTVLTLASGANLETSGLLNGVATLLTVAPGTGGVLTTSGGGGNLYVNAGAGAITVSAPINGTLTLVKNGSNTLTLTSTTSNFSGGVVLNAGTLSIDDVRSISGTNNTGGSTVPITVNGNSTISMPTNNLVANFGTGAITIINGATLTVSSASRGDLRFGGAVTGSGGVTATSASFWSKYSFTSTANDFTGAITDSRSGNDGIANALFSFNSISNVAGAGNIILNGATDSGIDYGSGATAALVMDYRQIVLANNNTVFFNNASSQAVNINTDIGFSGTGARQIRFGITGRNGAGVNTINGKLTDNVGGAFTPTFNGGTWVVTNSNNNHTGTTGVSGTSNVTMSGNNTLTGQITISGNGVLTLSGNNSGMTGSVVLSTNTSNNPRLNINSATALGSGILNFGGGGASDVVTIDNTSVGAVNVSTANAITMNRNFTFVGTQDLSLGTGTTTLGGLTSGTNRSITVTAKTLTLNGTIAEATTNLGITKAGAGTLLLSGTGNSYTGATTVSAGTLVTTTAVQGFGTNLSGISIAGAGTLSLRNDSTVSFTNGTSAYNIANSATGATINVDRVTGTGTNTLTVGNLTTTSTAASWGLNFTGANGVSLNAGALNTPVSTVAATHTITNSITGGGSLTLASVFNQATTIASPALVFTGTGNTTVTGSITQTLANMVLTKNGAGSLTLGGTNNYTGNTTVSAGTLAVTGSLGATAVSVSGTSILGGNGDIGGNVTIGATATHSLAVAATTGAQVTRAITGTLTLTAGNTLNLTAAATPAAGEYVLATATTAITGTPTTINYNGITGVVSIDTASSPKRLLLTVSGGTPYDTWSNGTFTNAFTDKLPANNQDGDTLTNLQEFAFGTDPTVSSESVITYSGGLVTGHGKPVIIEESGTYYAVFGRRVSYVADGLTYTLRFSADLSSPWNVSGATPTVFATDGTIEAVKVPFPGLIPTDSGPQKARFFDVGVSQ